ncbi:tetratricopeptide repeat domain containing protein [Theileria equi strain WA]|uniref:Tetratricopeptide repeat domain containing protein n=1 Tax=Theileria equi strain WA TaxID=1537102 RepID=L1LGQ0_THEEQ|nr:tetratricopeptide repeat domain containing protein [Theileria equi strain WA]EKX74288.1 tetratricopeptide repeat domain containing protein [Theileria equi strain WA]|eukprot:XP_004833740.1 tetratricopeptide repeat domain containing protein [Theileria equi strain WA]
MNARYLKNSLAVRGFFVTLASQMHRFYNEGNSAFKEKNYKLAASFYQKVVFVQLDYTFPEDDNWEKKFGRIRAKTNLNMALTQYKLANYNDCIRYCNDIINQTPANIKAHTTRGLSHIMLSQLEDAKKDFETIMKLDPSSQSAKEQRRRIDEIVFFSCTFVHYSQEKKHKTREKVLYKAMFGTS